MSTLALLNANTTDTIAAFPICTDDLSRMLHAVMPHRYVDTWEHTATDTRSRHIQIEIDAAEDRWPLLTMAAADGYTIAASLTTLIDSKTPRANWVGLIDGDRAEAFQKELSKPGLRNKMTNVTVTAADITIKLPKPRPHTKQPWHTTWHLAAVEGPALNWRGKYADAVRAHANTTATRPTVLGLHQMRKWNSLGECPTAFVAGHDEPVIVYTEAAIGIQFPGRFRHHEDGVATWRDNAAWAMPGGLR